jgi:hypothetical protein
VMRDGRRFTGEVTADEAGLVSHAGSGLLAGVADRVDSPRRFGPPFGLRELNAGHEPGA